MAVEARVIGYDEVMRQVERGEVSGGVRAQSVRVRQRLRRALAHRRRGRPWGDELTTGMVAKASGVHSNTVRRVLDGEYVRHQTYALLAEGLAVLEARGLI